MLGPGYNPDSILKYYHPKLYDEAIAFMGDIMLPAADVGKQNAKMEYIKKKLGIDVDQIEAPDFNFMENCEPRYNTICIFNVLEHLQNPLAFMKCMKYQLNDNGKIFLSACSRPQVFWSKDHFIEYTPEHLQKWILTPLGLEITRLKYHSALRHRIMTNNWSNIFGLRPLLRLFFRVTILYEIKLSPNKQSGPVQFLI